MCAQPVYSPPRSCALCHHWVCTQCGVKKETFPPLHGRPALTRCFCKTCLSQVLRNDPTLYALREIEEFEQRFAQECIRSDEIGVMSPVIPAGTPPQRNGSSSTTRRHSVTLLAQPKQPMSGLVSRRDSQMDADALAPRTRRRQVSEPPPMRVPRPTSRTHLREDPARYPTFTAVEENSKREHLDRADDYGSEDTDEARDQFDHENAPPNRRPTRGPTQIIRGQPPATQRPLVGSARSIATRATRAASDAGGEIMLRSDTRERKWRARDAGRESQPRNVNDMLEELCAMARETYDLTSTTTTSMRASLHHPA
ncbi:hypothetical protein PINS_up006011 [Pythium insidiosum]|nr:hypothetical protein PINS_up006011 [Pythium insidiosum]